MLGLPASVQTLAGDDIDRVGEAATAHQDEVAGEVDIGEDDADAAPVMGLPTIAVGYMKKNLNVGLRGSLADVLDSEAIHMIRTFETADHKAAAAAFVGG